MEGADSYHEPSFSAQLSHSMFQSPQHTSTIQLSDIYSPAVARFRVEIYNCPARIDADGYVWALRNVC